MLQRFEVQQNYLLGPLVSEFSKTQNIKIKTSLCLGLKHDWWSRRTRSSARPLIFTASKNIRDSNPLRKGLPWFQTFFRGFSNPSLRGWKVLARNLIFGGLSSSIHYKIETPLERFKPPLGLHMSPLEQVSDHQ